MARRRRKFSFPRRIKISKLTLLKRRAERREQDVREHVKMLRADLRFIKGHPWSLTKMNAIMRLINDCERGHRLVDDLNMLKGQIKAHRTRQRKKRERDRNK